MVYTTRRMQSRWEQCGNKAERNKVKRNANKKTWRDATPSLADKLYFVAWDLQRPANAARAAQFEANNAQPVIPAAAAAAAAADAESGTEQTGDDEARHPDAAALGPAHVPLTHAHMLHKDLTAVQDTLRSCQQASHAAAVASAAQVYDAQHAAANSASELAKQQQAVAQLRDNLAAERVHAAQLAADVTQLQAHLSVAQRNSSQASAHACKLATSNAALQGEHEKLQEHAASLQATLAEAGVQL